MEDYKSTDTNLYKDLSGAHIDRFSYSLIIPAYNEELRIGNFLRSIVVHLTELDEIIVVCDGTDSTSKIAREISPKIRVLEFDQKLGKGGAILEGFKAASCEVIGYVDADGAIPWHEVKKVLTSVSYDTPVAIGSRWMKGSKIVKRQPFHRILLGRIYHYVALALLGLTVKDTQCGLKAYRSDVVRDVLRRIRIRNLSIDTAFLYHCMELGFSIREIPIEWQDIDGSKFDPLKSAFFMLVTLIGLRVSHSRFSDFFESFITDSLERINYSH